MIVRISLLLAALMAAFFIPRTANAQYYGDYYRGYGGRSYYQPYWKDYMPRYSGRDVRNYSGYRYDGYRPYRGNYGHFQYGGGNRAYLGGRGGGWGGEW